jgi:membrane-associated protein
MEWFTKLMEKLDTTLVEWSKEYGLWFFLILGGVIFAETAVVIFPMLPGDSLLFLLGLLIGNGKILVNFWAMAACLIGCAILGNAVNYHIGQAFGEALFAKKYEGFLGRIFNQENLKKTHEFFERHGSRAVVISRFVPVLRGLVPFVAGMSSMGFRSFMIPNITGALLWVMLCMGLGMWLGGIEWVKNNYEYALPGVALLSMFPVIIEIIKHKKATKRKAQAAESESTSS